MGIETKEFCLNRLNGHAGIVLRAAGCCDAFDGARSKDDEKPQSVISNQFQDFLCEDLDGRDLTARS